MGCWEGCIQTLLFVNPFPEEGQQTEIKTVFELQRTKSPRFGVGFPSCTSWYETAANRKETSSSGGLVGTGDPDPLPCWCM